MQPRNKEQQRGRMYQYLVWRWIKAAILDAKIFPVKIEEKAPLNPIESTLTRSKILWKSWNKPVPTTKLILFKKAIVLRFSRFFLMDPWDFSAKKTIPSLHISAVIVGLFFIFLCIYSSWSNFPSGEYVVIERSYYKN